MLVKSGVLKVDESLQVLFSPLRICVKTYICVIKYLFQPAYKLLTLIFPFLFSYFNKILSTCRINSLRVTSNFGVMEKYFCRMTTLFLLLALMWNKKESTGATQSEYTSKLVLQSNWTRAWQLIAKKRKRSLLKATIASMYCITCQIIFFSFFLFPIAPPKVLLSASLVRALPGFKFSCSASGSPPTYTALVQGSTVLVNTTDTASIWLRQEGNYSCIATNQHGTDTKEFVVIFAGDPFFIEWTKNMHPSLG